MTKLDVFSCGRPAELFPYSEVECSVEIVWVEPEVAVFFPHEFCMGNFEIKIIKMLVEIFRKYIMGSDYGVCGTERIVM